MPSSLQNNIERTAFAFRGYNISNLGRTPELLAHPAYGPTVQRYLESASRLCSEVSGRPVDLVRRVRERDEPTLADYGEALALVMSTELAQVQLLSEHHDTHYAEAKLAYGYSLGELTAITCGGVFTMDQVLRIPLAMADDAAEMAANVTLGILFSRGPAIAENDVVRLVRQITAEGRGTIAISAILSPNSYLLMGQDDTLQRFKEVMHERLPGPVHLRINSNRWPPMHTPIVRQRHITDRASVMMEQLDGGFQPPCPPVISLVTGRRSYDDFHSRDVIRQWIDGPQRLWDAVCETLASGVTTLVHVGPEPNVIPATFQRLSDNIVQQTAGNSLGSFGMRAAAGLAKRPWLSAVLPSQVALLRAPLIEHVILEDWLLENAPG